MSMTVLLGVSQATNSHHQYGCQFLYSDENEPTKRQKYLRVGTLSTLQDKPAKSQPYRRYIVKKYNEVIFKHTKASKIKKS